MKNFINPKKITILSLFIAIGIVLQYIEGRVLISPIPGGKLGLCNIVTITNIFMFGGKSALLIAAVRSILGSIIFNSPMTVFFSFSGAIMSTISMYALKRYFYPKVSLVGISITGASVHNLSQLFVAAVIYKSFYVFSYLPVLLLTAVVSGFITGTITHIFISRTKGTLL